MRFLTLGALFANLAFAQDARLAEACPDLATTCGEDFNCLSAADASAQTPECQEVLAGVLAATIVDEAIINPEFITEDAVETDVETSPDRRGKQGKHYKPMFKSLVKKVTAEVTKAFKEDLKKKVSVEVKKAFKNGKEGKEGEEAPKFPRLGHSDKRAPYQRRDRHSSRGGRHSPRGERPERTSSRGSLRSFHGQLARRRSNSSSFNRTHPFFDREFNGTRREFNGTRFNFARREFNGTRFNMTRGEFNGTRFNFTRPDFRGKFNGTRPEFNGTRPEFNRHRIFSHKKSDGHKFGSKFHDAKRDLKDKFFKKDDSKSKHESKNKSSKPFPGEFNKSNRTEKDEKIARFNNTRANSGRNRVAVETATTP